MFNLAFLFSISLMNNSFKPQSGLNAQIRSFHPDIYQDKQD